MAKDVREDDVPLRHSYESAVKVVPDDSPEADDAEARGTEIGKPKDEVKSPSFDR